MKINKLIIAITLIATTNSLAIESIHFSAKIKDEALSEEAILFMHCLADETEQTWVYDETSLNTPSESRVYLEEIQSKLIGKYSFKGQAIDIELKPGEAELVCRKFSKKEPNTNRSESSAFNLEANQASEFQNHTASSTKWIIGGIAIAIGSFLLWKSSQPDHKSLTMK